jgi:hypothetical protein
MNRRRGVSLSFCFWGSQCCCCLSIGVSLDAVMAILQDSDDCVSVCSNINVRLHSDADFFTLACVGDQLGSNS